MIEIVNRQRKTKINIQPWHVFTAQATAKIVETDGKSLTIAFVSDRTMRRLNRDYRGKNLTTDVLSFASETDEFDDPNNLGDIVISVEQAARQASENHLDFETEIKQLILHGILHLCGFDHETDNCEMNDRELRLRQELKI